MTEIKCRHLGTYLHQKLFLTGISVEALINSMMNANEIIIMRYIHIHDCIEALNLSQNLGKCQCHVSI